MGKTRVSAVRAVALLLNKMEETQIHTAVKEAVNIQINEATIDTQKLIQDAIHKVSNLIKQIEDKIALIPPTPQAAQISPLPHTYTSALINPPPHANPKLAACEGIKARQFALTGLKDSAISRLNPSQLKTLTNKIIIDLGLLRFRNHVNSIAVSEHHHHHNSNSETLQLSFIIIIPLR